MNEMDPALEELQLARTSKGCRPPKAWLCLSWNTAAEVWFLCYDDGATVKI